VTTDRRFCRFSKSPETDAFGMPEVPTEGFCISAFVLLSPDDDPASVLLGHLNPDAPWDHLGALDPSRVEAHRHGWMIPSSHLMVRESPTEAAQRILSEQLHLPTMHLEGPRVVSEVSTPRRFPQTKGHWDLEFLFRGSITGRSPPSSDAWTELKFVDLRTTSKRDIARSHEDILASAGFSMRD
jgi:hypothetical protein